MDEPDPLRELERQVELGALFSHASLSNQAKRVNESYALLNGLVKLLVQHDVIEARALVASVESVREQLEEADQNVSVDVAVRVDGSDVKSSSVDCEARLHLCRAVCCSFRWPLSAEEVENSPLKWDLARPYFNRVGSDGYCHQCESGTHRCGVYEQRPTPCRQYSCEGDDRVWHDFEGMIPNQEWIDAHLDGTRTPVEIYMSTEADTRSGPA